MSQDQPLHARLAEQSERALAQWRKQVTAVHSRLRKWTPVEITQPDVSVPLAVVRSADYHTAAYCGDNPQHIGDDLEPGEIDLVIDVHRKRQLATKAHTEHMQAQAVAAGVLIERGWTFRKTADALGITTSRILQLVGAGKSTRKPVRS